MESSAAIAFEPRVEGRISASLVSHLTWKFLHILLFVYWLGADLGMFLLARAARQPGLSFEQRYLLLRMAMLVEVTPRMAFILMIPVGLQLAAGLGLVDVAGSALLGIWLTSLAWLALVIALERNQGRPAGRPLARLNLSLQVLAGSVFMLLGASSLLDHGPFMTLWLSLKVFLFGLIFVCSIMIDVEFRPTIPAFGRLAVEGSTPDIERLIAKSIDRAMRWVLVLYALLLVIGYLGTTKPHLIQPPTDL